MAVSKFQPLDALREAYDAGQRLFGENRPQEFMVKATTLPSDIQWHFIGHLQSNKIKMVAPYAYLIHSVDRSKLLYEIDNYCLRNALKTQVLLEIHIAREETKQGFSKEEVMTLLDQIEDNRLSCTTIRGLMAMASFTDDTDLIRSEFSNLLSIKKEIDSKNYSFLKSFDQLSFGMSHDYHIAIEIGSTLVRVGTTIFGPRPAQNS